MCNPFRPFVCGAILTLSFALSACATQNGPRVDPIFSAVPGGRYACANAPDERNPLVKSLTSSVGEMAIGGALGGLLGNQFGSGTGQNIATGAGAAAGVAAGAWNANRMSRNRYAQCEQNQQTSY